LDLRPVTLEGTHVQLEPMRLDHYERLAEIGLGQDIFRYFPIAIDAKEQMLAYVKHSVAAMASGEMLVWATISREIDYREIDVNLHGVYHCSKAVAKALVEQGEGGRVVNISSLAGRVAQPQYGGYTPGKFAVIGLTQMLALELAPHNVTVNAVCLGSTYTDMMDGTFRRTGERMGIPFETVKQGVKRLIPLGRQADPAEIASVVAYLASPAAAYITGQAINVDGGIVTR
jgi:NAD(P)-dependent dehydrogenase (short-subunit alcohol dehydrogenase family)